MLDMLCEFNNNFIYTLCSPFYLRTLMPKDFQITLVILMVANLATVCMWQFFIVNGRLPRVVESKLKGRKVRNDISELRSSQTATKMIDSDTPFMESNEDATSDQSGSKDVESNDSALGNA